MENKSTPAAQNEQPTAISLGSLTIDISSLAEALEMIEKIKAAAGEARIALDALAIAPVATVELIAGELVCDETQGMILAELRGLRAEMTSSRRKNEGGLLIGLDGPEIAAPSAQHLQKNARSHE